MGGPLTHLGTPPAGGAESAGAGGGRGAGNVSKWEGSGVHSFPSCGGDPLGAGPTPSPGAEGGKPGGWEGARGAVLGSERGAAGPRRGGQAPQQASARAPSPDVPVSFP